MKKVFLIIAFASIFSCTSKKEKPIKKLDKKENIQKQKSELLDVKTTKNETEDSSVVSVKEDLTVDHYICYLDDKTSSKKIWISFNQKEKAIRIKYKGQTDSIQLIFEREEYIKGGTHPTIINYYSERYNGKTNGVYKLTHSGNWDYVEYIRGKDNKVFNFTIDHNAKSYGKKPCF